MDKTNACRLWVISDLCRAPTLKEKAFRHLVANKRDEDVKVAITETLKAKPHLIADLIEVMGI